MEALVIKAVIPALEAFPDFNATLDGDDLIVHGAYHIGIAVDTPDGLLVAVVRDAGPSRSSTLPLRSGVSEKAHGKDHSPPTS